MQPSWTYTATGAHIARVRVTDTQGFFDIAATTILIGESRPVATITTPTSSLTWKVGDVINFSGSATDLEDGPLGAASLAWTVSMQHCPGSCHEHPVQTFSGVSSGSFSAPDHDYPSHLELTLTATDSAGLQDSVTVPLNPKTVSLTFATNPSGLQLTVGPSTATAPFSRTVIVNSNASLSAPSPQALFQFQSWSDGGAQSHNIVAPTSATMYTATFAGPPVPTSLVAGYSFEEGGGNTVADSSGRSANGTVSGATWSTQGRFGNALSFDGVDDFGTYRTGHRSIPDQPAPSRHGSTRLS